MIKNKKKVTITVLSILIIGLIISLWNASTYALFSSDYYGANYEVYSTGNLSIVANSKSDNISLTNAIPMSDEEGLQTSPYVFTIKNDGNIDYQFDVKLLATNSNTFSPNYIKLQIDGGVVQTLSQINSTICYDLVLKAGESIDISIRAWLDENTPNTEIGKSFESKITIDGQAIYTESNPNLVTPFSDFTYYLGSEYSTVNTIHYEYIYSVETELSITPIQLQSNEILLVQYNGESADVVIPNTYVIDDVSYNVVVLFGVHYMFSDYGGDTIGVFTSNKIIENVDLGQNIKVVGNSMDYAFVNCTSLVKVSKIPTSVTTMYGTFSGCTSLVDAPEISDSVTNVREIFSGCTSLVRAPEIPASVTNMISAFYGCTSLVNAPEIPASVTNMGQTFLNCTNLTGTVKINSSNVSAVYNIFYGTSKPIRVEVPAGSTTYTNISALTTSNGMPSNVKLAIY